MSLFVYKFHVMTIIYSYQVMPVQVGQLSSSKLWLRHRLPLLVDRMNCSASSLDSKCFSFTLLLRKFFLELISGIYLCMLHSIGWNRADSCSLSVTSMA